MNLIAVLLLGVLVAGDDVPRPTVGNRDQGVTKDEYTNPLCGTCTEPQNTPGCSNSTIEACVCANDPFCCTSYWDGICVDQVEQCDPSCFVEPDNGDGSCDHIGNCGHWHAGTGCDVPEIEACVCAVDSFCCDDHWDNICVGEVFDSPCYVDCDCGGVNFYGGDDLPSYWENIANMYSVNTSLLGFNAAEGKWCYDMSNTCIKWGEWNGACDDTQFACAGYINSPATNGHGTEQMAMIREMYTFNSSDHKHWMCPVCEDSTPCGSGATPGTDNAMTATFTDCDCVEHHSGFPLIFNGYWWNAAAVAGLDPTMVTQREGKWYYNGVYTCVAMGSYGAPCDDSTYTCAGSYPIVHFGTADEQMGAIMVADTNGGVHPSCPP